MCWSRKAALDPHKSHIVGDSFSVSEGGGIYVPVAHKRGANAAPLPELWAWLAENFFASPEIIKVAPGLSFEVMYLYGRGIVLQPPVYDTIAAAQMTPGTQTEFRTLADSGLKRLSVELPVFKKNWQQTLTRRHAPEGLRHN